MKLSKISAYSLAVSTVLLVPAIGYCDLEDTLRNVQYKFTNVLLPLAGILGLCFAALSFFSGNPNARNHLWLAILGACVGFGSSQIIEFLHSMVH